MTGNIGRKRNAVAHPASSYVIIDLEWNQPIPWIRSRVDPKVLPGEIIEIGAVKITVTENGLKLSKPFHAMVRPVCYTVMNRNVSRVINKMSADLKHGMAFADAYDAFIEWCGSDYILCGWGNSDVSILKANLLYHGRSNVLGVRFLDVQPLFSKVAENENRQRSVEYAVDFLKIPKIVDFHEAHRDAEYTGKILMELFAFLTEDTTGEGKGDDTHRKTGHKTGELPDGKSIISQYLYNPDLVAQVSWNTELYHSWEQCFSANRNMPCHCPACGSEMSMEIGWFRIRKGAFSLWRCAEHNLTAGRMRMKKNPVGKVYASICLKLINPAGAKAVYDKHDEYTTFGPVGKPVIRTAIVDKALVSGESTEPV